MNETALVTVPTSATRSRKRTSHVIDELNPLAMLRSRPRDRVIIRVILVVLTLWWIFPLAVAVSSSLGFGGLQNYLSVLTQPLNGVYLGVTFLNSAVIAIIHAVAVCVVSALAGLAFSRLEFPWREQIYYAVLIFLAVPGAAIIVPVYYISGTLGLFNSYFGVALPEAALTLPFGVLLMKNFADGLQASTFEAAAVDGANTWQTFQRIYMPQVRSPLINLAILSIMWSFQDFIFPSLLLRTPELTTASQAVQTIRGAFGATPQQNAGFFAALVLLSLPAVLLVTLGLRWVSRGLTSGGSKE
ncbi:carbohydrate ABC transporter permease [Microbacterium sp. LWH7-1.2]|uniref:carbohydrate ABC transporter permease n=1 Tax=Microbacterium sp. LWH7-1.2 TaxID=3135257 RepID=UPI00313A2CDA